MIEKNWRFYNAWKLCNFALKNGLRIARSKCLDDVVLWTRLWDCNTIRRVLPIHNINILVVIWRLKENTQFRIVRHVVLLQKPFLVINSVHNTTSQDDIEQSGLLIFCAVAEPQISRKSAKSREIHKNMGNPAKFARNLTFYMSAQHISKLSWLLGLLTCCNLANLPWNFVTPTSKQNPKTTRRSL